MSSKPPHITVRTDAKFKAKMQFLSHYNGRSLSKEAERILKKYVQIYEEKYGPIKLDE